MFYYYTNIWKRRGALVVLLASLTGLNCQTGVVANRSGERKAADGPVAQYTYEVVNTWHHDPDAYTQGLLFSNGSILESTGREGKSTLRRVELETGKVLNQLSIPSPYFAEGLTLLNGKLFQLTWQHGVGFIYDPVTFDKLGEFKYSGEGWGLTTDGNSLILSDGTNRLRFLDPETFKLRKSIAVFDRRSPITNLNELEYAQGEIYANIWHDERLVRIDPNTGQVTAWIDLKGLRQLSGVADEEGVLNGIAYDEATGRFFVTGKLWPKLFEIRLKRI